MPDSSARDVVLEMLCHRFGARHVRARADLLPFQQDAFARVLDIMALRHGAILGDSVGLGKTHVARAVIEDAVHNGESVVVCAPAQLAQHWKRHLRGMEGWEWLSHARASRGVPARMMAPGLIIVDEAHAFRNPRTRRYANLRMMLSRARLLLLTATPVNNSILDFYHLVRLFCSDDEFLDAGIPDLMAAFRAVDASAARRVAELVMVRRTRETIERSYGRVSLPGAESGRGFPECTPMRLLHYDLNSACAGTLPGTPPGKLTSMLSVLQQFTFPAHALSGRTAAPELMRMTLLKRLESSAAAFTASLERYEAVLTQFLLAAEAGLFFDPMRDSSMHSRVQGSVQLSLARLTLRAWPTRSDRPRAMNEATCERDRVRSVLASMRSIGADPKLERLKDLLRGELRGRATLVFTEFRETALHIWSALAPGGGVALITGKDARLGRGMASRRAIIERFAPISNHVRAPAQHQRVSLLIATDVLAEGLNLQDASAVVSYDVPWNPVRLAQRIGRIDRLGSPHREVNAYAFRPGEDLDEMLGLVRRIRTKLRAIRSVGGDAPRVGSRARPPAMVEPTDLDRVERLRAAWRQAEAPSSRQRPPGTRTMSRSAATSAVCMGSLEGAICCVRSGGSVIFVLVEGHARAVVGDARIDGILLDVLRSDCAPIGMAGEGELLRIRDVASAAVRRRMDRASTGCAGIAARQVRRWLASRPVGVGAGDAESANVLLERIRAGDTRVVKRLSVAADVREVERIVQDAASHNAPPEGRNGVRALSVVGILVLRPECARVDPRSRAD